MTPPPLAGITFVRQLDGLRYDFARETERNGRPAYLRTDGQVWCCWSRAEGWHCESADGIVNSRPLNDRPDTPEPPATVWRSFKNDRSYLYDLRVAAPDGITE
ncbi:hypothetical protein [Streptomyces sp. NPDC002690]